MKHIKFIKEKYNYKDMYIVNLGEIRASLIAFPGGSVVKNLPANAEYEFDPWVRKIPWRRKWQPIPIFLPGESHGQKSLVGYSPWGHKRVGQYLATETTNEK